MFALVITKIQGPGGAAWQWSGPPPTAKSWRVEEEAEAAYTKRRGGVRYGRIYHVMNAARLRTHEETQALRKLNATNRADTK